MELHEILTLGFRYRLMFEWDEVDADNLADAVHDLLSFDPMSGTADYLYLDIPDKIRAFYFREVKVAMLFRERTGLRISIEVLRP